MVFWSELGTEEKNYVLKHVLSKQEKDEVVSVLGIEDNSESVSESGELPA